MHAEEGQQTLFNVCVMAISLLHTCMYTHVHVCTCTCTCRCLYMSILVGLLLACGGLLTAFLYPRNVDVTILAVNSTEDYVDLGIVSNVVDFFDDSDDVALLAVKVMLINTT